MKKTLALVLSAAVITMSAPAAYAREYYVYDTYSHTSFGVEANPDKDGLKVNSDKSAAVKVKDGKVSSYTGFARTKKGVYCYKDGVKYYGWYRKNGKWYYFDSNNDGLMAVQKAKTSLGTYYFDENGAWNYKLSKSSKMPKDFSLAYHLDGGESTEYYLNTADGILRRDAYIDGVETEKKIKISAADMQIIYDSFKSNGVDSFDFSSLDIELGYTTDMPQFSIGWNMNGCYSDLNGDSEMFCHLSSYEEIKKLSQFICFTDMYMQSRPEYQQIIAEEEAYKKAHQYDYAPFDELTQVKTQSADVYKFRGFSSPSGGRARLITSKSEMDELIAMLKAENISGKSKLIKRLSSYDEDYFKENAVVFGDCIGASGMVSFDDPKIYTGYSNIYIEMTLRYPECYTDDVCYAAAVAEVSKNAVGCENEKPNVIWRRTQIDYEGNVF